LIKCNYLIGSRTCDLPACGIIPQPLRNTRPEARRYSMKRHSQTTMEGVHQLRSAFTPVPLHIAPATPIVPHFQLPYHSPLSPHHSSAPPPLPPLSRRSRYVCIWLEISLTCCNVIREVGKGTERGRIKTICIYRRTARLAEYCLASGEVLRGAERCNCWRT
jgi:hypothetical protein